MMKEKKGYLLRDFVIVGIIFGMIMSLYILEVANVARNYDNNEIISSSFASHYDKFNTNLNQLDSTFQAVKGGQGLDLIGVFDIAFNSVFNVIAMIWNGISIYTSMGSSLVSDFSFIDRDTANILITGTLAILTAGLIFIWISSVMRGKI